MYNDVLESPIDFFSQGQQRNVVQSTCIVNSTRLAQGICEVPKMYLCMYIRVTKQQNGIHGG